MTSADRLCRPYDLAVPDEASPDPASPFMGGDGARNPRNVVPMLPSAEKLSSPVPGQATGPAAPSVSEPDIDSGAEVGGGARRAFDGGFVSG